jgi:hypothetical protein
MAAPNPLSSSSLLRRNTFISKSYIADWETKDAIREVLQNQYDGINMKIGKSNIKVIPKGTDRLNAFEFEFRHKETNELYGEIKYNETFKELEVWNVGSLETADLLLGCQKGEQGRSNNEIIGRFGEGMKLAALTFLKNGIDYRILTTGEEWIFKIEADPKFTRNGQPQDCLFLYTRDITGEDINTYKDKVYVILSNIDKNIWKEQIDNFLWLTQQEKGKVIVEENGKVIGEILLGEKFCYKNYVKEIYVDKIGGQFGLNLNIKLDRDRNCIPNINERNSEACKLIANVLSHLKKSNDTSNEYDLNYLNNPIFSRKTIILLREFPKRIFNSLYNGNGLTEHLYAYLDQKGATLIFNEWEIYNNINDGKQPADPNYIYKYIYEKKLDNSFYPFLCYHNWYLFKCLEKSIKYMSIDSKFKLFNKNSEISEIPDNCKPVILSIVQKVKLLKENFSENNLKFKKYKNHNDRNFVYSENNIIYFSFNLFNEPENKWKFFVFSKCLELNNINIEKIAEKFSLI